MTFTISGLTSADFAPFFAMDEQDLHQRGARRVTVDRKPGFPCRISLQDAEVGESVILLNHTSHDVDTPYRSAYAIYVRDTADAPPFVDCLPPVFESRPMALRAFDAAGMLRDARLALRGDAAQAIADLFANRDIAYIHAHNAAHGCFSARIDRA